MLGGKIGRGEQAVEGKVSAKFAKYLNEEAPAPKATLRPAGATSSKDAPRAAAAAAGAASSSSAWLSVNIKNADDVRRMCERDYYGQVTYITPNGGYLFIAYAIGGNNAYESPSKPELDAIFRQGAFKQP